MMNSGYRKRGNMRYKELKIKLNKDILEIVEAELIEAGFSSMMIDDPDDALDIIAHPETYKYDYIDESLKRDTARRPAITLYFEDDDKGLLEMKRAADMVSSLEFPQMEGEQGPAFEIIGSDAGDDSEWLYKWQEFFKPTKVGSRIVVKPTWEEYAPGEGDLVIEMDPGMAFGSGLHGTTSMCIKALERLLAEEHAAKVLDVGCGTGILAIAAALLGADECLGIDIDPDAVRVANENIAKNGLEGRITAQLGDLTEGVDYKADIVVANLMADLVIKLAPAAFDHVNSKGWFVTSGILDIKEEIVCDEIVAAGFDIVDILHDGEWRAVIARRSN